jgi:hypothetical protein
MENDSKSYRGGGPIDFAGTVFHRFGDIKDGSAFSLPDLLNRAPIATGIVGCCADDQERAEKALLRLKSALPL